MVRYCLVAALLLALSGCGSSETAAPQASADSAKNVNLISFTVPGMTCPHGCVAKVRETLATLPGVEKVEVDFESKTATCTLGGSDFDSGAAVKALAEAGFDESVLKPTS